MASTDPELPEVPPADPEDWTDEQWLDWLRATDGDEGDGTGGEAERGPVTPMGRVTRSAGGAVLGQAMLGLANAMFGEKNQVVVVADGNSEPDEDEPLQVRLDPDHPERSTVVVRQPPPDSTS